MDGLGLLRPRFCQLLVWACACRESVSAHSGAAVVEVGAAVFLMMRLPPLFAYRHIRLPCVPDIASRCSQPLCIFDAMNQYGRILEFR